MKTLTEKQIGCIGTRDEVFQKQGKMKLIHIKIPEKFCNDFFSCINYDFTLPEGGYERYVVFSEKRTGQIPKDYNYVIHKK